MADGSVKPANGSVMTDDVHSTVAPLKPGTESRSLRPDTDGARPSSKAPSLAVEALALAKLGLHVFPCKPSDKSPLTPSGFKDATRSAAQIVMWWAASPAAMIGLATGAVSGVWALDVDCKPDADGRATLKDLEAQHGSLPRTPMQETPSGGRHYLFKMPADARYIPSRVAFASGLDTRGDGGYICIAPSVRHDGKSYRWVVPLSEPLADAPTWLLDLIGQGSHHGEGKDIGQGDVAPGFKDGLDTGDIKSLEEAPSWFKRAASALMAIDNSKMRDYHKWVSILHAVKQATAGDEAFYQLVVTPWCETYEGNKKEGEADRVWASIDTTDTGWGKLREYATTAGWKDPDPTAEAQHDFAEPASNEQVEPADPEWLKRMNKRYFVSYEGGKTAICHFQDEAFEAGIKRRVIQRSRKQDITLFHSDEFVQVPNGKGGLKSISVVEAWLAHPGHRKYDRVVFEPNKLMHPSVFNLWRGFAIEPKAGEWSLLRDHLFSNVCRGNEEQFDYLMRWLAYAVQHPDEPGHVAIVMRGGKGVGKSFVGATIGRMFGQNYFAVSNSKHLVGNFNRHLEDCLFLFADEAFYAGDKQSEGVLKQLITDKTLTIEAKFFDARLAKNRIHLLMASNSDWVVPASIDERRYFVLDVGDACREKTAYFAAIDAQMTSGGTAAMLHDLLAMDLTGFDVRHAPATQGLVEQKLLSLDDVQEFWRDILTTGELDDGLPIVPGTDWGKDAIEVSCSALYRAYVEFAQSRRIFRPKGKSVFGRELRKLFPSRSWKVTRPAAPDDGYRPRCYVIPPLPACRAAFEKVIGHQINWE